MGKQPVILVVDDDPHLREVMSFALSKEGFDVRVASDGQAGVDAFQAERPDLVVLDVMMPKKRGTDVCREIRSISDVPIIFLTSVSDEIDRVVGFELGADDYVTKPFSPRELVSRVRAILRRSGGGEAKKKAAEPAAPTSTSARRGPLNLDRESFQATCNGEVVDLTPIEFRLLLTLMERPQRVFERDGLMRGAYDDVTHVSDRTIDSHIRKIRSKFSKHGVDPIETVHGVGYRIMKLGKP